jgi:hypothetical protein
MQERQEGISGLGNDRDSGLGNDHDIRSRVPQSGVSLLKRYPEVPNRSRCSVFVLRGRGAAN